MAITISERGVWTQEDTRMEPIKYFDSIDLIEPKCGGCQHIIHYDRDTVFDNKKNILTCAFCGHSV